MAKTMIGTLPAGPTTPTGLCAECGLPLDGWCACGKPLVVDGPFVRQGGRTIAEIAGVNGQWRATPVRSQVSKRFDDALRGRRFASAAEALDAVRSAVVSK